MLLLNAFSLNMVPRTGPWNITANPVSLEEARDILSTYGIESAVGHPDTARVLTDLLGIPVYAERLTVTIPEAGAYMMIAQYSGPRLPEGATTLPQGATITWWTINIAPAFWDA